MMKNLKFYYTFERTKPIKPNTLSSVAKCVAI